jgi:hypothetical protein
MLDLRVGPGVSVGFGGNLEFANDQPLSTLVVDGVVSLVKGGVACLELNDCLWL